MRTYGVVLSTVNETVLRTHQQSEGSQRSEALYKGVSDLAFVDIGVC